MGANMIEENRDILDKVDSLQEHFYNYLFNKCVRDISLSVQLKEKEWDYIKSMEGQKSLLLGRRNFRIEEIYDILIPFANFLKNVHKDILPNLKHFTENNNHMLTLSPQEKSIRRILLDNYKNNIYSLGKIILELYDLTVVEDIKENSNKTPLCLSIKEIKNIEEDLRFIEEYPL